MIFDYVTLKIIWWLLFCVIVIAFMITAGLDVGVNFLLPIVGKSDYDRRLVLNAVGPTWEGNQVWLVLFVAGMLAIWPPLYATMLYSMYFLCLFLVFALILRPPGFDYRNKINNSTWRTVWDMSIFVAAIVICLSIGILIAKLFSGVSFQFDVDMRPIYTGTIFTLISPLSLLCFAATLALLTVQGGLYLQYKLQDVPLKRSKHAVQVAGWTFLLLFVVIGMYVGFWMPAYKIDKIPDLNSSFLATAKIVSFRESGWSYNFVEHPMLWLIPAFACIGIRAAMQASKFSKPVLGLILNSIGIACGVFTVAIAVFPFMLPSNLSPNHSLTIWDAAASAVTLQYALLAVVFFLPIVLGYTIWVYRVMRGKVVIQRDSY